MCARGQRFNSCKNYATTKATPTTCFVSDQEACKHLDCFTRLQLLFRSENQRVQLEAAGKIAQQLSEIQPLPAPTIRSAANQFGFAADEPIKPSKSCSVLFCVWIVRVCKKEWTSRWPSLSGHSELAMAIFKPQWQWLSSFDWFMASSFPMLTVYRATGLIDVKTWQNCTQNSFHHWSTMNEWMNGLPWFALLCFACMRW